MLEVYLSVHFSFNYFMDILNFSEFEVSWA